MKHKLTQTEWEIEMCEKILNFVRSELYLELRFLDFALSALKPKADASLNALATDGIYLKFSPGHMLRIFERNPKFLSRAYLHSVLHCIFAHLWTAGNKNRELWNTACDIAVEYTIDNLDKSCTKRILTWLRQNIYQKLQMENQSISAAVVYRIIEPLPKKQLAALQMEFFTDDHTCWPQPQKQNPIQTEAENRWNKIARQTLLKQEQSGSDSADGGRLLSTQIKAVKSRRSYRDFLKKFSVLREEMHCSLDEFDLNFYTYGLKIYGNMPLIEPLETREIRKIQEFVIVVDTSDSTSGKLVKNFLRETFQILHQKEHFFTKCRIRILQCDDQVRMDQEITDLSQAGQMLAQFTIIGGGGTNFCPAFNYVNTLISQGIFENLAGLLYFTDGEGIYPKKRPPYQTAFLFLGSFDESKVPPWAMRLKLEPEEFSDPPEITKPNEVIL